MLISTASSCFTAYQPCHSSSVLPCFPFPFLTEYPFPLDACHAQLILLSTDNKTERDQPLPTWKTLLSLHCNGFKRSDAVLLHCLQVTCASMQWQVHVMFGTWQFWKTRPRHQVSYWLQNTCMHFHFEQGMPLVAWALGVIQDCFSYKKAKDVMAQNCLVNPLYICSGKRRRFLETIVLTLPSSSSTRVPYFLEYKMIFLFYNHKFQTGNANNACQTSDYIFSGTGS